MQGDSSSGSGMSARSPSPQNPNSQNKLAKTLCERRRREQESVYLEELAELVGLDGWKPPEQRTDSMRADKCSILQEAIAKICQIQRDAGTNSTKSEAALQQSDVSSSRPAVVGPEVLGPILLEALDGFLLVVDRQWKVEFVSDNVTQYLKYNNEDMMSQSIFDFIHKPDQSKFRKALQSMPIGSTTLGLVPSPTSNASGSQTPRAVVDCRIRVKPASGENEEEAIFQNMQISAVSQLSHTDHDQSSSDQPHGPGSNFLVCIARRLGQAPGPPPPTGVGPTSEDLSMPSNPQSLGIDQFSTRQDLNATITHCDTSGVSNLRKFFAQTFVGHNLLDFCHVNDQQSLIKHFKEVDVKGKDTSGIYRLRVAEGRYVFVRTESSVFRSKDDSGGKPTTVASTHSIIRECDSETELKGNASTSLMKSIVSHNPQQPHQKMYRLQSSIRRSSASAYHEQLQHTTGGLRGGGGGPHVGVLRGMSWEPASVNLPDKGCREYISAASPLLQQSSPGTVSRVMPPPTPPSAQPSPSASCTSFLPSVAAVGKTRSRLRHGSGLHTSHLQRTMSITSPDDLFLDSRSTPPLPRTASPLPSSTSLNWGVMPDLVTKQIAHRHSTSPLDQKVLTPLTVHIGSADQRATLPGSMMTDGPVATAADTTQSPSNQQLLTSSPDSDTRLSTSSSTTAASRASYNPLLKQLLKQETNPVDAVAVLVNFTNNNGQVTSSQPGDDSEAEAKPSDIKPEPGLLMQLLNSNSPEGGDGKPGESDKNPSTGGESNGQGSGQPSQPTGSTSTTNESGGGQQPAGSGGGSGQAGSTGAGEVSGLGQTDILARLLSDNETEFDQVVSTTHDPDKLVRSIKEKLPTSSESEQTSQMNDDSTVTSAITSSIHRPHQSVLSGGLEKCPLRDVLLAPTSPIKQRLSIKQELEDPLDLGLSHLSQSLQQPHTFTSNSTQALSQALGTQALSQALGTQSISQALGTQSLSQSQGTLGQQSVSQTLGTQSLSQAPGTQSLGPLSNHSSSQPPLERQISRERLARQMSNLSNVSFPNMPLPPGGSQNNLLSSGPGGTLLSGGPGGTLLSGGPGGTLLSGGPGSNLLSGGPGSNLLSGPQGLLSAPQGNILDELLATQPAQRLPVARSLDADKLQLSQGTSGGQVLVGSQSSLPLQLQNLPQHGISPLGRRSLSRSSSVHGIPQSPGMLSLSTQATPGSVVPPSPSPVNNPHPSPSHPLISPSPSHPMIPPSPSQPIIPPSPGLIAQSPSQPVPPSPSPHIPPSPQQFIPPSPVPSFQGSSVAPSPLPAVSPVTPSPLDSMLSDAKRATPVGTAGRGGRKRKASSTSDSGVGQRSNDFRRNNLMSKNVLLAQLLSKRAEPENVVNTKNATGSRQTEGRASHHRSLEKPPTQVMPSARNKPSSNPNTPVPGNTSMFKTEPEHESMEVTPSPAQTQSSTAAAQEPSPMEESGLMELLTSGGGSGELDAFLLGGNSPDQHRPQFPSDEKLAISAIEKSLLSVEGLMGQQLDPNTTQQSQQQPPMDQAGPSLIPARVRDVSELLPSSLYIAQQERMQRDQETDIRAQLEKLHSEVAKADGPVRHLSGGPYPDQQLGPPPPPQVGMRPQRPSLSPQHQFQASGGRGVDAVRASLLKKVHQSAGKQQTRPLGTMPSPQHQQSFNVPSTGPMPTSQYVENLSELMNTTPAPNITLSRSQSLPLSALRLQNPTPSVGGRMLSPTMPMPSQHSPQLSPAAFQGQQTGYQGQPGGYQGQWRQHTPPQQHMMQQHRFQQQAGLRQRNLSGPGGALSHSPQTPSPVAIPQQQAQRFQFGVDGRTPQHFSPHHQPPGGPHSAGPHAGGPHSAGPHAGGWSPQQRSQMMASRMRPSTPQQQMLLPGAPNQQHSPMDGSFSPGGMIQQQNSFPSPQTQPPFSGSPGQIPTGRGGPPGQGQGQVATGPVPGGTPQQAGYMPRQTSPQQGFGPHQQPSHNQQQLTLGSQQAAAVARLSEPGSVSTTVKQEIRNICSIRLQHGQQQQQHADSPRAPPIGRSLSLQPDLPGSAGSELPLDILRDLEGLGCLGETDPLLSSDSAPTAAGMSQSTQQQHSMSGSMSSSTMPLGGSAPPTPSVRPPMAQSLNLGSVAAPTRPTQTPGSMQPPGGQSMPPNQPTMSQLPPPMTPNQMDQLPGGHLPGSQSQMPHQLAGQPTHLAPQNPQLPTQAQLGQTGHMVQPGQLGSAQMSGGGPMSQMPGPGLELSGEQVLGEARREAAERMHKFRQMTGAADKPVSQLFQQQLAMPVSDALVPSRLPDNVNVLVPEPRAPVDDIRPANHKDSILQQLLSSTEN